MATTTHRTDRTDAIAEYDAYKATWEAAKARGDAGTKDRRSAEGHMAICSMRIREAELELTLAGEPVDPWVKPAASGAATKRQDKSQAEIEASLAQIRTLLNDPATPASVVKTAQQRETALLKAATARGYEVE